MNPEATRAWRALSRAEKERRVITRLLKGDVIAPRVSTKITGGTGGEFPQKSVADVLRALESRGIIYGYGPYLSDDGRKYFAGLSVVTVPTPTEGNGPGPSAGDPDRMESVAAHLAAHVLFPSTTVTDCVFCRSFIAEHHPGRREFDTGTRSA
jgi:hypothetical protein